MTKRSVNDLRTDLAETLNRVAYKRLDNRRSP
jgi:hypothetical protein